MMVGRDGSWRINTLLKGFAQHLGGFASSYSGTGDHLNIGKRKTDMLMAFERMQAIGGGNGFGRRKSDHTRNSVTFNVESCLI